MEKPIKLGILGAGSFVKRRILPILSQIPLIEVIAIQKRDLEEAKKVAEEFHIPFAVSSREELIYHKEVDAVFIATPNMCHEEDAIECAKAKKPTLCEKPLAPSSAAILRMQEAFAKTATPLFVAHSLRFKPAVQKARKLLQEGSLGKLLHIRAYFTYPAAQNNWRWKKSEFGGAMLDVGVHLVDLIHFISRSLIADMQAVDKYEHVLAQGVLDNGANFSLECAIDRPLRSGFEVIGDKGRMVSLDSLRQSDSNGERLYLVQEDDIKKEIPVLLNNIYVDELTHFAKVWLGEENSLIDSEVGLQSLKAIERLQ